MTEQQNKCNWYASNSGTDACNQAMIADEDTGKTIAVLYDREDAPFIIKACSAHEVLVDAVTQVLDASEDGGDMDDIDWNLLREALAASIS